MLRKTVFAGMIVFLLFAPLGFGQSRKAVHITEGQCGFFDGDGNVVLTSDVKIVVTNSAKGNVILKCRAKGVENNQGTAVHWDAYDNPIVWSQKSADPSPMPCAGTNGSDLLLTEDWQILVSETGNAVMTCRFRLNEE